MKQNNHFQLNIPGKVQQFSQVKKINKFKKQYSKNAVNKKCRERLP